MATVRVLAPAGDSVNETVGGVEFRKGVATVDRSDAASLAYFRRHGYLVEGEEIVVPDGRPIDARDAAAPATVGTKLRDAAVDPEPQDFLPPSNAGQADPHGPEVVSPGLHGVEGVRPVTPGLVPPAPAQEPKETASAEQATSGEPIDPAGAIPVPARSAPVAAWRDYAVNVRGVAPGDAENLTKTELVERYGEG